MAGLKKKAYTRRRRPVYRKRVVGRKRSSVSVAVKRYVKSTIHKQIENKSYQIQWSQNLGSYNNSNTLFAFPLTPYAGGLNILQGITQSTRIGNQIKPRKLIWDFILSNKAYDAVSNPSPQPMELQLIIASLKQCPGELPSPTDVSYLYQLNASAIAPSGNISDLTQKFNTDVFNIHKVYNFKLGYSTSSGTGTLANYQAFANNDFKLNIRRRINLMKYCPKNIVYNDNASTPTSRCVFAMWNLMPCIAGSTFASSVLPARLDSTISIDYEDA